MNFFLSLLIIASVVATQSKDCNSIKIGTFRLTTKESGTTVVTRTYYTQKEENEKYGVITEDSIKWLSNCRYQIRPWKILKNKANIDLSTDLLLEVEILEVHESFYNQRTTSKLTGQSRETTVTIVK
jgi:hypothetical protein